MHRRQFLAGTGTAAIAFSFAGTALAETTASTRLASAMDAIFMRDMQMSPMAMTDLGIDTGQGAWARHRLDGFGRAAVDAHISHAETMLADVRAIPADGLSVQEHIRQQVVEHMLEQRLNGREFGMQGAGSPYVMSHMGAIYSYVPSFLDTKHPVQTVEDAEAYLDRLTALGEAVDQESALQREQAAKGYAAPAWSLEIAKRGIDAIAGADAAQTRLVGSLVQRAEANGLSGDWTARATTIVQNIVQPAFARQSAMLADIIPAAAAGDGIWRVPQGDEIYRRGLAHYTTTSMTADEIHKVGLDQVAELTAELDMLLAKEGLTSGSVGERLTALNERPDQIYPDTPEGHAALIGSLNEGTKAMWAKLPQAFARVPTQPMEIYAVPAEIEDSAAMGYYESASLDGSRPARYYINLKNPADWPKYTLPALTYHEGVPGHHLQGSLVQEAGNTPLLLKNYWMSSYGEGWALYAEQVADELGGYEGVEKLGALQSWLFRAARLVVDTGLHSKQWSVDKATQYFIDAVGYTPGASRAEIQRYCIWPGQACSYKIGQNKWRELRSRAETKLGSAFDLRQFHTILDEGTMPLSLLEQRIDVWIESQMA
ncbi:DUF885 domain-containing protein [Croceicoccus mobilis]|uniref:DUF885 domain-containing protein n=1 Tax=Croceicoccus mobilis TaxID=1703339 RepID=A0A916YZW6_9SPHN|nr:DUF885 family protein [Croceicoccus mobilis]GGD69532.1 hypothetical protein GCM10010990_18800 [Croceicoccus mobilis]